MSVTIALNNELVLWNDDVANVNIAMLCNLLTKHFSSHPGHWLLHD